MRGPAYCKLNPHSKTILKKLSIYVIMRIFLKKTFPRIMGVWPKE
jgi:hypothetical protein